MLCNDIEFFTLGGLRKFLKIEISPIHNDVNFSSNSLDKLPYWEAVPVQPKDKYRCLRIIHCKMYYFTCTHAIISQKLILLQPKKFYRQYIIHRRLVSVLSTDLQVLEGLKQSGYIQPHKQRLPPENSFP